MSAQFESRGMPVLCARGAEHVSLALLFSVFNPNALTHSPKALNLNLTQLNKALNLLGMRN